MDDIEFAVGATYLVELPGLGTAGYRWFATIDNAEVVAVRNKLGGDDITAAPPGASRNDDFIVIALHSGTAVVRFDQRRVFEPEKAPNATRSFRFRVM